MIVLSWIISRLSRRMAAALAFFLGWTMFYLVRARRRVAWKNISRSLPALSWAERTRILRQSYTHLGHVVVETFRLSSLSSVQASEIIGDARGRIEGLRRPQGLLVAVAHLGLWDLLACASARAGIPVNVVTRQIKSGRIDSFWRRLRERSGVRLLPAEGSALAIRRALRRGELVGLAIDQHQPEGLPVPFFGRLAATTDAPARLAIDSGAPLFFASLVRRDDGVDFHLRGPIEVSEEGEPTGAMTRADRVMKITRRLNAVLEEEIRACPEQWFWIHRRWKIDGRV